MSDTTRKTTTRRPGTGKGQPVPAVGSHTVAVQFSAWGPQRYQVHASGGGGRQDLPYIAVAVGDCLTYVYDRAALTCHVQAWRRAADRTQAMRLPTVPAAGAVGRQAGQDLTLVCTVLGPQRTAVTGEVSPDGIGSISVVVGAVTVRALSSEAVRCYLLAWTRAETLGAILDDLPDSGELPG